MAFGIEIKRLRELAGLSVKKIADSVGINSDRLKQWEIKNLDPKFDDRQLIESFFDLKLEEIVKLEEIPKDILQKIGSNGKVKKPANRKDLSIEIIVDRAKITVLERYVAKLVADSLKIEVAQVLKMLDDDTQIEVAERLKMKT